MRRVFKGFGPKENPAMETKATEIMNLFEVGKRYTLYKISEALAMTNKTEITVTRLLPERALVVFKARGKKNELGLQIERQDYTNGPMRFYQGAIFEGWDQPIQCDTERRFGVMRGNACYNFIGTPETIRQWIELHQLNPFFEKACVVAIDATRTDHCGNEAEIVVYPELVRPGYHAVIDRLMQVA
jgi:hypothetical protein